MGIINELTADETNDELNHRIEIFRLCSQVKLRLGHHTP